MLYHALNLITSAFPTVFEHDGTLVSSCVGGILTRVLRISGYGSTLIMLKPSLPIKMFRLSIIGLTAAGYQSLL